MEVFNKVQPHLIKTSGTNDLFQRMAETKSFIYNVYICKYVFFFSKTSFIIKSNQWWYYTNWLSWVHRMSLVLRASAHLNTTRLVCPFKKLNFIGNCSCVNKLMGTQPHCAQPQDKLLMDWTNVSHIIKSTSCPQWR